MGSEIMSPNEAVLLEPRLWLKGWALFSDLLPSPFFRRRIQRKTTMATTSSRRQPPKTPPMIDVVAGPELLDLESPSESADLLGTAVDDGASVVEADTVEEGFEEGSEEGSEVDVALGSAVLVALVSEPLGAADWSSSIIHSASLLQV